VCHNYFVMLQADGNKLAAKKSWTGVLY